jgi:cytochrome c oxidase subunit 2
LVITFAVRYRQGNRVNRTLPGHEGHRARVDLDADSVGYRHGLVPVVGQRVFQIITVPKGAMEVYVVGKQWMWKLQHPSGRWEMNELHVPVGRPVKLTMISEDVIHSFGIPAFALSRTCFRVAIRSCGSRRPRPGAFTCSARSIAAPTTPSWAVTSP